MLSGVSHEYPLVFEPSPRTPPESRDLTLHSPHLSFSIALCPVSFPSASPAHLHKAPLACKLLFPQDKASGDHTNSRVIRRALRGQTPLPLKCRRTGLSHPHRKTSGMITRSTVCEGTRDAITHLALQEFLHFPELFLVVIFKDDLAPS